MWNHEEENEYDMPDLATDDGESVSDNLDDVGNGKDLKSAVNLCQESSTSLMTTVSSLRAQLPGKRGDGAPQKAGPGRQQREWGQIGPLTLQVLSEALGEQHPHLPALTNANALETCAHVTDLSLQFKGLGSLDFMWMFRVLTKLELSNNSITVIRGLEKLTRLTWLDLSFNQIERINGLSELHELEVLALHNNQLDRVDRRSLLALSKLQVLTLANNNLSDIHDVRSLRVLEELASVTLAGNPMCDSRYPNFVLAHLPRLAYLDQRRVTPAAHAEAALQYKSEVSVVEAQEEKGKVKEREAAEARKSQEEHRRAGVLALNDGSLFTRMFRGDKDMGVLLQLQGIHPVMAKYRDQFNAVCMKVFNAGLAHEEQRQSELELLHDALHLAKRDADCYARGVVKKLESQVEEVLKTAHELREAEEASLGDDQEAHAARVTKTVALKEEFESNICTITQDLLNAEVTLADQIKDVVGRAREELGTLVGNFLEEAAAELQEGRRLAYSFYCRLRELTSKVVESGGVSFEGADPRAAKVFEGGDTLTAALAGIHDRHLALIDARESDLQDHLHQWLTDTLNHIEKMEWARHRSRVEEITTLTARQRQLVYDAMPLLHD